MSEQMTLDLTQAAIELAREHAHQVWVRKARRIVEHLAAKRQFFTTDEVWSELAKTGLSTPEPRALGAVMQAAVRDEIIIATGRYWPTKRPSAHKRPVAVYMPGVGR